MCAPLNLSTFNPPNVQTVLISILPYTLPSYVGSNSFPFTLFSKLPGCTYFLPKSERLSFPQRETKSTSPALLAREISVSPGFSTLGDPPRSPCAPAGASRPALNGRGCASPLKRGRSNQGRASVESSTPAKQFGKVCQRIPCCLGPAI